MLFQKISAEERNRVFAQIASRYHYLEARQVEICWRELRQLNQQGRAAELGHVAVLLGYLTEEERYRLSLAGAYHFARREDEMLGWVGIQRQLLGAKEVRGYLQDQAEKYRRGERRIPRLLGVLSEQQVLSVRDLIQLLKAAQRFSMWHRPVGFGGRAGLTAEASGPVAEGAADEAQKEWPVQEIRSAPRFEIAEAQVLFRPHARLWRPRPRWLSRWGGGPAEALRGALIDLSVRGLQTLCPAPCSVRQLLRLALQLPLLPSPLEARVQVRWTTQGPGPRRLGARFVELDETTEKILREFAANPFLRAINRAAFELLPLEGPSRDA